MTMTINNIKNPAEFFKVLEQCKGTLELATDEGDTLNLKSKLCQYLVLSEMFKDAKIDEMKLVLSDPSDLKLIMDYLVCE